MLFKIVSFTASLILLFTPSAAMPEKGSVLIETLDNLCEIRTADKINGETYILRHYVYVAPIFLIIFPLIYAVYINKAVKEY